MTRTVPGSLLTPGAAGPAAPSVEGSPGLAEVAALLQGARDYLEGGRLPEAEALVTRALNAAPEQVDALHLAGILAHRAGREVEALEYLDRAIARYPRLAAAHTDRGDTLVALGHPDEAISAYRQSLVLWPGSAIAWCHLGHALQDLSRPDEALRAYREAIARQPDFAEAHLHLGLAMEAVGDAAGALEAYQTAVGVRPDSAPALDRLGLALLRAGRTAEATEALRRAVSLDPRLATAARHLGVALVDEGQLQEAADVLQAALSLEPEAPEAHHAMGRVRQRLGYLDQALAAFRQAIAIRPDYAEAHLSLGELLDTLGCPTEALASIRAALTFRPDFAAAYRRLGVVLGRLHRTGEAVTACRRAIELVPELPSAWAELGDALRMDERYPEAVSAYGEALARQPDDALVQWHRGLASLALGDFRAGWAGFEWRWRVPELGLRDRPLGIPRWQGESLAGRTILVHAEGSLAETLLFARYLPLLAERGARVVLECAPSLRRLLEAMPCVAQAIVTGEALPVADCELPLGCLPRALAPGMDTLPEVVPYLPTRIWSCRVPLLPPGSGIKVGLALGHGGVDGPIPPTALAQLLATPGISWYQLDDAPSPFAEAGVPEGTHLHQLGPTIRDAADATPLLGQLDLVITTDATLAHLAGGVGTMLWVVTGPGPDWALSGAGGRTPWYPTARLFRRGQAGEWGPTVEQMRGALLAALAA